MTTVNVNPRTAKSVDVVDDIGDGSAYGNVAKDASVLPEPSVDPMFAFALLEVKLRQTQRETARQAEAADLEAVKREGAHQVAAIREKAQNQLIGGLATGLMSIGSGALTAGAAVAEGSAELEEIEAKRQDAMGKGCIVDPAFEGLTRQEIVEKTTNNALELSRLAAPLKIAAGCIHGGSAGLDGGGKILSGAFAQRASDDDATIAEADNRKESANRRAESATSSKRQSDDDLKFVIDWYKGMQQTRQQMNDLLYRV